MACHHRFSGICTKLSFKHHQNKTKKNDLGSFRDKLKKNLKCSLFHYTTILFFRYDSIWHCTLYVNSMPWWFCGVCELIEVAWGLTVVVSFLWVLPKYAKYICLIVYICYHFFTLIYRFAFLWSVVWTILICLKSISWLFGCAGEVGVQSKRCFVF